MTTLALSIRQPWAWMILHAGKDIENRDWPTKVRGRFLIHASNGMTKDEYRNGQDTLANVDPLRLLPPFDSLARGGIVGSVELVDCVTESESEWFFGPHGFLLRDPKPMQFEPCKGRLGFFNVVPQEGATIPNSDNS